MLSCVGRKKCSSKKRKPLSFKVLFPELTHVNHLTETRGTPKHVKKELDSKSKGAQLPLKIYRLP